AVAVVGPAVPAAFLAGVLVGARVSARVCWAKVRAARAAREAAELRRDAAIDAAEQLEGEARRLERHIGWLVARPAVAQRAHRVLVQGATSWAAAALPRPPGRCRAGGSTPRRAPGSRRPGSSQGRARRRS